MMTVKVEGLEEMSAHMTRQAMNEPLGKFFKRSAVVVQAEAKRRAPVDTGRLRRSISYNVDGRQPPLWAEIGSDVHYAPYMEYGTGLVGDGEGGSRRRHWPPAAALEVWAQRHGFQTGFQVARIIGLRGGLRPRRYLRGALKASLGRIEGFARDMGEDLKKALGG